MSNSFISLILSPFYWVKSLNYLRKEEDSKAYKTLKKINEYYINKPKFYKYYLFLAFASFSIGKYLEAKKMVLYAIKLIDNENIGVNEDEKLYLKCYSLLMLKNINIQLNKNTNLFDHEIEKLKKTFKLENINLKLLDYFPL